MSFFVHKYFNNHWYDFCRLKTVKVNGIFFSTFQKNGGWRVVLFETCCHHHRLMKSRFVWPLSWHISSIYLSFNVRCNWLFLSFSHRQHCELHLRVLNSQSTNYWFQSVNVSDIWQFGFRFYLYHFLFLVCRPVFPILMRFASVKFVIVNKVELFFRGLRWRRQAARLYI